MSRLMSSFDKPLTKEDVLFINYTALSDINNTYIIRFKNTKELDTDILSMLDKSVFISVEGGYTTSKKKYDNDEYFNLTLYERDELISIINEFKKIENGIDKSFSNLEKVMFVYKELATKINYFDGSLCLNGAIKKDVLRSLRGILYRVSLSSGFSLLFKEMMDRLDIKCDMVNKSKNYDWNVIYIDNSYISLDLTYESINTHNNNLICDFSSFSNRDFYTKILSNDRLKFHEIIDNDEVDYSRRNNRYLSKDEILKISNKITKKNTILLQLYNAIYNNIIVKAFLIDNDLYVYNLGILYKDKLYTMKLSKDEFDDVKSNLKVPDKDMDEGIRYIRKDNSVFYITKSIKGNNYYNYIEKDNNYKLSVIYSRVDLLNESDYVKEKLLDSKRVKYRVQNYNGNIS